MHFRSLTALAFVALAAAQQPLVFKRSVITSSRDLGVMRRSDGGYQPEDEVCSKGGNTCAEACGSGYQQCKSTDQAVHCYNPAVGETCCSTTTGNSCLSSFYCTHDPTAETFCCPGGMNLGDCAVKHGVTGALTSDVPVPTAAPTTSKAPTTSSVAPPTTSSSSPPPSSSSSSSSAPPTSSSVVVTTSSAAPSSSEIPSSTVVETSTSFSPSPTLSTSTVFSAANATLTTSSTRAPGTRFPSATPATTTAASEENAAATSGPAGMAVILGAALLAVLL